jgi:hypothetical protein
MFRRLLILTALLILPAACNFSTNHAITTENAPPLLPSATPTEQVAQAAVNNINPAPVPTNTVPAAEMTLVYYYFPAIASNTFPAGSVTIVPGVLILSPTLSGIPRSADTAANVQGALHVMLNDPRNVWTGSVTMDSVTVNAGQASVSLNGNIDGAGDAVLIAARWQIVMTVFTDSSVQSAVITLNGQNIGNLGISNSNEARTTDAYSRAEVERFMAENAYNG